MDNTATTVPSPPNHWQMAELALTHHREGLNEGRRGFRSYAGVEGVRATRPERDPFVDGGAAPPTKASLA